MNIRNCFRSARTHAPRIAFASVLLLCAQLAHGTSIFKCIDAHGPVAFQQVPCNGRAAQTEVPVHEQPLIDPNAPAAVSETPKASRGGRDGARTRGGHARAASSGMRKAKEVMSYECRAANGAVFYRHSRCPSSLPGDGVARFGSDQTQGASRHGRRSRGGAWDSVRVQGSKIPRSEACKQINAVTAGGRDGNRYDEQVSPYDHNVGRDPCIGY